MVLIAYVVEFLLVGRATSSTFFILMMVTLLDVAVGFAMSGRHGSRRLTLEQ